MVFAAFVVESMCTMSLWNEMVVWSHSSLLNGFPGVRLPKAYSHEHEIVNETFNDDRWRWTPPLQQMSVVSSESNTAWSKR